MWPRMEAGDSLVMRAALHLGGQASLMCLRGGEAGAGEIALRLPVDVDLRRVVDSWEGLRVSQVMSEQQPGQHFLRITPADEGYRDLYTHLADDVHDHLEGTTQPQEAVRVLLSRLRLWASFLRRGGRPLDARTVRGLFTELMALEQLLVPALGWADALGSWSGPSGTPQDVITDRLAMDVKATREGDGLISISSIEQLDPPGRRAVRLLEGVISEGHGESLAMLVNRLQASAAASGHALMFLARLAQTGVTPAGLQEVEEQPMTLLMWRVHDADHPDFPRLIRAAVPMALVNASYRIDLSRSTAPPGDLDALRALLAPADGEEHG